MFKLLNYTQSDMSPDLQSRIDESKAMAMRVSTGTALEEREIQLSIIWFLSKYYRIPVFSSYFGERTLDELIFESELISLELKPSETRTSDILNSDKKEAEALFDDWAEDDFQTVTPNEEQWAADAAKFMATGAFKD